MYSYIYDDLHGYQQRMGIETLYPHTTQILNPIPPHHTNVESLVILLRRKQVDCVGCLCMI